MKRFLPLVLALILLTGCGAGNPSVEKQEKTVYAMDTVMTLTVYPEQNGEDLSPVLDAAESEIRRLDALLSISNEQGDIYRLNHDGSASVTQETGLLVQRALSIAADTDGAFDPTVYPLMELSGKTFGIVGYGRIGQATAELARAFGMNVIYYSRHGSGEGYVPLDELYARSDIVSLHCPQTPENVGMIDKTALAKMKDGVILLNTARGGLINEADLRDALLSGKVYAAASDVVSTEPIRADNPLLGLDNMIITPHIAWASHEARQRLMDTAVENVRNFLNGTPSNNVAK